MKSAMNLNIRPIRKNDSQDVERLVELSLAAWEPVFDSFNTVLGSEIYLTIYVI